MGAAGDVGAVISPGNVSTALPRVIIVKDTPGLARGARAPSEKQAKLVNGAKPKVLHAEARRKSPLSRRTDFNPSLHWTRSDGFCSAKILLRALLSERERRSARTRP